jgi:regulator of sigma E protease
VIPATVFVSRVSPDSPAERAGLERGDLILAVDGEPTGSFRFLLDRVRSSQGRPLRFAVARAGETREVVITPELEKVDTGLGIEEERYRIGIQHGAAALVGELAVDRERNPLVAVPRAAGMTIALTGDFLRGLGKLVTGELGRDKLAGPIGIAEIAGKSLQRGWEAYLSTLILISINLGILNLLPIPILDGGQILIAAVEGIQRAPISLRTREIVQQVGLTMLVLLMGLAFWNDLSRHWSKFVEWLSRAS